ncbi:MAG: pentapeptide repeat-containing protein [Thiotrichaceae bacterium]
MSDENRNTGDSNTGDSNTGSSNTGSSNTGDRNTGDWNTGSSNTGYWNNCNYETGFFNTIQSDTVRIFNKEYSREEWNNLDKPDFIYFDITEWIHSEDMTDKEKEDNPTHETTCGYLRKYEYKEAFKKSWDEADKEDRKKVFNLPNFDAEIFLEISGIDVSKDDNSDKIEKLKAAQKDLIDKANEIKKQIEELK